MELLKIRGIFLFIISFSLVILALAAWQRARGDKAKMWLGYSAFFVALYAFFCGGTYFFWKADSIASIYWYRTTWLGIFLLPPFIIFTYHFVQNIKYLKIKEFFLYVIAIAIGWVALGTNLIVKSVYFKYPNISSMAGPFDFLGRAYIAVCVAVILFNLLKEYFKSDGFRKIQLQYFILGVTIFFVTGIITTAIIPLMTGESSYYDIAAYASFFWVALTAMAIFKYNLFNIKVIATELLMFLVWISIFINFIVANSLREKFVFGGLLLFLLAFGILLVRSVLREVAQRERLEKLTEDLQKANEELKRTEQLKAEFFSFAAHQVKSPMAVIKGYATLIGDGTLAGVPMEKIAEVAKKIGAAASRTLAMVNNLLDMRKIEEGRMAYAFQETDVVAPTKAIVEDLGTLAKDKGLEMTFESSQDEIVMNIDLQKFSQVIQNLIDNAVKYTDAGWIKVRLNAVDGNVLFEVSDSGRGFSKEFAAKMFEQFARDPALAQDTKGTGLGLFIAKQIVEAHGGTIWAFSEGEGAGSTFSVKMPLKMGITMTVNDA